MRHATGRRSCFRISPESTPPPAKLQRSFKPDPNVIRIRVRMQDNIEPECLRYAADMITLRYPYFCVELQRNAENEWVYEANERPVIVAHARSSVDLNTRESNNHLLAFSWQDDWIIMDIFHALTDGIGAYALMRTLLNYYCFKRYHVEPPVNGIRLVGDAISREEWMDPMLTVQSLPPSAQPALKRALKLPDETEKYVYSLTAPEAPFIAFCKSVKGSPATMLALFLSRAIAKLYPESEDAIRVGLLANWRPALQAPLAHQCLFGALLLEYDEDLRTQSLDRQIAAYRAMVSAQTRRAVILKRLAADRALIEQLLSKDSEDERLILADQAVNGTRDRYCASVSYIGKANLMSAEPYIQDFRTWTSTTTSSALVELSAVNGRMTFDVIQRFSDDALVTALLAEFEGNGLECHLQDVQPLNLPNVRLPWTI